MQTKNKFNSQSSTLPTDHSTLPCLCYTLRINFHLSLHFINPLEDVFSLASCYALSTCTFIFAEPLLLNFISSLSLSLLFDCIGSAMHEVLLCLVSNPPRSDETVSSNARSFSTSTINALSCLQSESSINYLSVSRYILFFRSRDERRKLART